MCSFARSASSSGVRFSRRVAIVQRLPAGSFTLALAVSVEHVGRFLQRGCPRRQRPCVRRVGVRDVDVEHAGEHGNLLLRPAHHHVRVADDDFRVPRQAVLAGDALLLRGVERGLQEIDEPVDVLDDQVGRHRVVALGDRIHSHRNILHLHARRTVDTRRRHSSAAYPGSERRSTRNVIRRVRPASSAGTARDAARDPRPGSGRRAGSPVPGHGRGRRPRFRYG